MGWKLVVSPVHDISEPPEIDSLDSPFKMLVFPSFLRSNLYLSGVFTNFLKKLLLIKCGYSLSRWTITGESQ